MEIIGLFGLAFSRRTIWRSKKAERICVEAGLPKKTVTVAGALANFQSGNLNFQPILSNAPAAFDYRSMLWIAIAIVIALAGWFIPDAKRDAQDAFRDVSFGRRK